MQMLSLLASLSQVLMAVLERSLTARFIGLYFVFITEQLVILLVITQKIAILVLILALRWLDDLPRGNNSIWLLQILKLLLDILAAQWVLSEYFNLHLPFLPPNDSPELVLNLLNVLVRALVITEELLHILE